MNQKTSNKLKTSDNVVQSVPLRRSPYKINMEDSKLCPVQPRTDLLGNWIWAPKRIDYEWRNSYVYFRKRFNAEGEVLIHIAAETHYDLFIDGERIDRGTAPSEVAYKTFDTHTLCVKQGTHVIAVMVHYFGEVCATAMKSRPGLFVEMKNSSGPMIVTDATWKVSPSFDFKQDLPCMMSHFGFYEV